MKLIPPCFHCQRYEGEHVYDDGVFHCMFDSTTFRRMTQEEHAVWIRGSGLFSFTESPLVATAWPPFTMFLV